TGAGPGGGPHVRAFRGTGGAEIIGFFAYGSFTGGVFVAGAGRVGGVSASIISPPEAPDAALLATGAWLPSTTTSTNVPLPAVTPTFVDNSDQASREQLFAATQDDDAWLVPADTETTADWLATDPLPANVVFDLPDLAHLVD